MSMNFKPYITRDPAICGGEPVITGTRITVRTILASLAEGMSTDELLLDFPRSKGSGLVDTLVVAV